MQKSWIVVFRIFAINAFHSNDCFLPYRYVNVPIPSTHKEKIISSQILKICLCKWMIVLVFYFSSVLYLLWHLVRCGITSVGPHMLIRIPRMDKWWVNSFNFYLLYWMCDYRYLHCMTMGQSLKSQIPSILCYRIFDVLENCTAFDLNNEIL